MEVKYMNTAKKSIKAMDHQVRVRVERALAIIPSGDIIPMYQEHTYRLRVGKYRLIFAYDDGCVLVHRIASRGDVYKGINC